MELDPDRYSLSLESFLNDSKHPYLNIPLLLFNDQKKLVKSLSRNIIYYRKQKRNCGISTLLEYFTVWNLIFNSKNVLFCNTYDRCVKNSESIYVIIRHLFGKEILEKIINKRAWANLYVFDNMLISSSQPDDPKLCIDKKNTILIIDDYKTFKAITLSLKLNGVLNEFYKSIVIETMV